MLLLVIVVLVGLGVIYKFNSAFSSFAQNYFVNYLSCLIETGELPALGGASISSGQCSAEFQAFDPNAGRPLVSGGGGSGGSPGDSSEPPPPFKQGGRPASQSRGGQSQGSSNAESAGSKSENSPAVQKSPSKQVLRRQESAVANGGVATRKGRRIRGSRRNKGGFRFLPRGARDRKASRAIATNKRLLESLALRKSVMRIDLDKPKIPPPADLETNMGVSGLIRMILILGILIAIIIFLGSQLMQLKKSWEKPDADG